MTIHNILVGLVMIIMMRAECREGGRREEEGRGKRDAEHTQKQHYDT